ncbi:MAG: hypothetical protein AAF389_06215 [Gemmatimonadota bacterium]
MPRSIVRRATLPAVLLLAALSAPTIVSAQAGDVGRQPTNLFAGDSVRVDGEVGRILSLDGSRMTVVSRAEPVCRAGQMHGDAPICDPAPLIRNSYEVDQVFIERRSHKSHLTARTIVGGLLGAAAFGTVGYFVGPEIGFGKIDGCVDSSDSSVQCSPVNRIPRDVFEARQLEADQRRGVIFFGAIGGSLTAILVRKLSVGWVHVQPTYGSVPSSSWDLSVSLPR